ncbi:MAG TPA: outer membrane beta-barrel family protein, partial [Chitinophagaceae bacterium]|nr:outer membrane beta-barrel family protein [Chitinophagaceae bacterium]
SSTTVNYAWKIDTIGSGLKVIGDYTSSTKTESNTVVSAYDDTTKNATYRTNTPSTTRIYSIQGDYTKALNDKTALKGGAKYVQTNRNNTLLTEDYDGVHWAEDPAASNQFKYDERLLMFYSSFEKSIQKTSIKAGLRGEQTWSRGHSVTTGESIDKNYFGLFPSLFIDHAFNEKKGNSVHFNYSRRVKRPGYNDLNPYRLQVNDYSILTGNPNLLPQYTHSLQAGYTLHQNFTADVYLLSTHNFIAQTASTIDSNVIVHQSKNYPNNTEYGLSLNGSFNIVKAWNVNNSLLLYHVSSDLTPLQLTKTSLNLQSIHTITLKKIADIDVVAQYNSPYLNANAVQAQMFYMDIGMTRRILKGQGRLRLNLSDIFNTFRERDLTEYNNTRIDFYQKRPTRTVSLSFTYNFKAGKAFTKKKIDQNNSEEKSRLGN